ncbi:efflux RND transporter periplasmic adaptor subunit [Novosphingobium aquimarinum]|uniref:efflux RND transporter periplasmic adaptor subunit n=1 Tax=Novosphingobium aquimarinum TaxID=2682494 RepID=UPI001E2D5ED7|nr:efflux RND transporter periplasmic adaptor subunit [Novosphingobium aquimarinum]
MLTRNFRPFTALLGLPALASAALLLTLGACGSGSGQSEVGQRPPTTVGFITVKTQAVPLTVKLDGRTVAFETSEVRPQVSGVIRKRLFTEGGYVRAGQPLFQIDPSLYRAAVNQAQANLASARASAEAASAKANRYRPLAEMEAIAQQDYTDAAAQARVARSSVQQNAATLDTAKINLRFTTVPAPISGRIGRSLVTVGGLANASQETPLAVIQRTDPIYVDMQQSAAELVNLRRRLAGGGVASGSTDVRLLLDDGSEYALPGTVQFSEVTVDEETGTVTLRARFPNPEGLLLPGMFVSATFNQAIESNAILVPQQAVQRDFDGSAFVMLVGPDNKAVRRKVETARAVGQSWVVTKGLARGDKVIVQGLNDLKSGATIKPVAASSPQKVAPPPAGTEAKAPGGAR